MNYLKIAYGNARNILAEKLYINLGIDITRPVQIYGITNYTCNARCLMCDHWKKNKSEELPASYWIMALQSLKDITGTFHINLSGGEPLLKKDFFDILEFCSKEKIMVGFTTNGLLLNKKNTDRILRLNITNINISIDSMDDISHDTMRGIPGLLEKVKRNIEYLISEKKRLNKNVQIILKTIVGSYNMNGLDKIVRYAKDMNLTGVNFQPVSKWTKDAEEMFKVGKKELSGTIDMLMDMKKKGYDIINSIRSIQEWGNHFNEAVPNRNSPCPVALRNLTVFPGGDVYLCLLCQSKIGNIVKDDIKLLWKSDLAKKLRKKLVRCNKVCTYSCVVKKSLKDYISLFFKFVKS